MPAPVVREEVQVSHFDARPASPPPEKTWEELTSEEREALMKRLAEERGYVKR